MSVVVLGAVRIRCIFIVINHHALLMTEITNSSIGNRIGSSSSSIIIIDELPNPSTLI